MPRFGMHAAAIGMVRTKESEERHVGVEPLMQRIEHSADLHFFWHQTHAIAFRHSRQIDHVNFTAPMMAAGARHRTPTDDRVHQLVFGQARMVAHISMLVIEWIFSSKFSVPDFLLALEIAE